MKRELCAITSAGAPWRQWIGSGCDLILLLDHGLSGLRPRTFMGAHANRQAASTRCVGRKTVLALLCAMGGLGVTAPVLAATTVTQYTYDAGNHVTTVTDPRGLVTAYNFDGLDRLWGVSSPDIGTTTYNYDSYGRRSSLTRANSVITTYGYDVVNRLTSISAAGQLQTFAYDNCTNGLGRLCSASDATGSTAYTYTPEGWTAGRGFSISGTTYSLGYGYDAMGHLVAVTYPDGHQALYNYSNGMVSGITFTIGTTQLTAASGVTWQPMNAALSSWTSSNGLANTLSYDTDGRVIAINTPGVESLGFSYDTADRLIGINNAIDGTMSQDFGYDDQSRLVSLYSANVAASYGYDANGNRISKVVNGTADNTSYSVTSNQLVNTTGTNPQSYGYDALGNVTTLGGVATYQYDAFNRMNSGDGMSYYVSPEGQRLRKGGGSSASYFALDANNTLLAEYSNGAWVDYVWLGGRLIGREVNGQLEAVGTDQVGRPQVVTDASQTVVWNAQNWPFTRSVTVSSSAPLNLGFPGQYYDAESGLWNNGLRDYDPVLGRYIESDPIGLKGGLNTYAYVDGDPISSIDPNGTNWSSFWAGTKNFFRTHEYQIGGGVSAFGVLMGGSLTGTVGVSVKGVTLNFTSCGGVGGGAFAGAGIVAGLQKLDPCPNRDGTSTSKILAAEGGEGLVGGGYVDTSGNGGISLGKGGVGIGGYVAAEICTTKTFHPVDF